MVVEPRFLPIGDMHQIVERVLRWILEGGGPLPGLLDSNPQGCYVVVLGPSRVEGKESVEPKVLLGFPHGDRRLWSARFEEIARRKAFQLWYGLNDGRPDVVPHLLLPGDTRYWGGVKREGLVVACSGLPPRIDRLVSGMIADALIARADQLYRQSDEVKQDLSFI